MNPVLLVTSHDLSRAVCLVSKLRLRECFRTSAASVLRLNGRRKHSSAAALTSDPDYCSILVRKSDYENFLCCLLLPQAARRSALAIRAFNVEVSRVQDSISDPTIGKMRLQFWSDTVDRIYDGSPPHTPIAKELHQALQDHKLNRRWFTRLIDSRKGHLHDQPFPNLAALERYSEESVSSLLYLILECLDITSMEADHAASHLGKAQGIVTVVRSIPYHSRRGVVLLPPDLLLHFGVSPSDVLRGSREKPLRDAIFEVASAAYQQLEKFHALLERSPKMARIAFLPAVHVKDYLERLRKVDFDVFHPALQRRNNLLPLVLWWKRRILKF